MGEALILSKALIAPILQEIVKAKLTRNHRHQAENIPFIVNRLSIKQLVEEGKGILDIGKGLDLEKLKNLAVKITVAEIYGDTINYIFKHKIEGNIKWEHIQNQVDQLLQTLQDLICELSGQPSENHPRRKQASSCLPSTSTSTATLTCTGHEEEGMMPPGNVRRCLLYLSRFPEGYVFNCKWITRLSVTHEFIAADSSKLPLQQLANWLKVADSSWDGDGAPYHFLIGNDVGKPTSTWPERHSMFREALVESMECIPDEKFLSSLIFLHGRNHTLNLEKREFFLLKTLTLRNVTLENEKHLEKLSLLQYLDLKYTKVLGCHWLKGLEELQLLDLRYTSVEKVDEIYLEKLGKLQHLLLGYCPKKHDNRLAGAKLNIERLRTTNLKTLRAIRRPAEIQENGRISKVADLSVTGLKTRQLKSFWDAVASFENLTSLGVAVTDDSVITLQDCPAKLKKKLERLRMEGQFPDSSTSAPQTHSELLNLRDFNRLTDLTLASHKSIDISRIPPLPDLLCLRLYGVCEEATLTFGEKGFKSLKKLVIGDMKILERVVIASAVIKAVATIKLCNLPQFKELVCLRTKLPVLRCSSQGTTNVRFEVVRSRKTIFLKGVDFTHAHKSPGLKLYHYDMDKQCYKEVIKSHDNQT